MTPVIHDINKMLTSKRILSVYNFAKKLKRYTSASVASVIDENNDNLQLKSYDEIPGPPSLPFIGQIHNFFPGMIMADVTKAQETMYKLYGPISKLDAVLSRHAMVILYDPEAIAFLLRSEDMLPVRPGFASIEYYRKIRKHVGDMEPTGLISDHGELWRYFRTTVNKVMLQPKTIRLYQSAIEEVAEDMIKRMRSLRNDKNMIESSFDTEMNLWALESIGVVALGSRLNCFTRELPEDSPEKRLIRCVHDIFKTANEIDFGLSPWKYFSTKGFRKAMKLYEEQETLAKYFVTKARNEMIANKKPDEEKGVLEKLLDIDEKIAVIMASDMLFAGVDTTGTTMIATLYLLGENKGKQDKLREEIMKGESKKYLKACIKESLRVLPVVSGNMRMTTKEYNILGYRIPKNTHVAFMHQYISSLEEQFPRAKEYIPERWLEDGELSYKSAHPFAYNPFGFGARMCIGRRIAELELETFLSKVIKNFDVEWFGPPPKIEAQSLNYIRGPFNFIFKDVN